MAAHVYSVALRQALTGPKGAVRRHATVQGLAILADAKRETPVDTNRLRSSEVFQLTEDARGLTLRFVAPVGYAAAVHNGTRPHMPPVKAVAGWAQRHGTSGFVVARAIAARGTKAHPFFLEPVRRRYPRVRTLVEVRG